MKRTKFYLLLMVCLVVNKSYASSFDSTDNVISTKMLAGAATGLALSVPIYTHTKSVKSLVISHSAGSVIGVYVCGRIMKKEGSPFLIGLGSSIGGLFTYYMITKVYQDKDFDGNPLGAFMLPFVSPLFGALLDGSNLNRKPNQSLIFYSTATNRKFLVGLNYYR